MIRRPGLWLKGFENPGNAVSEEMTNSIQVAEAKKYFLFTV